MLDIKPDGKCTNVIKPKAIYVWGGNKVFNGFKFELVKFQLTQ